MSVEATNVAGFTFDPIKPHFSRIRRQNLVLEMWSVKEHI